MVMGIIQLQNINGWPEQLLSVACLSLAAKMEETLVPSLLEFQVCFQFAEIQFTLENHDIFFIEFLLIQIIRLRVQNLFLNQELF